MAGSPPEVTSGFGVPLDPVALTRLDLTDVLVYGVCTDLGRSRCVITIEIVPSYHAALANMLALSGEAEVLVDLAAEGVAQLDIRGCTVRPKEWKDNEKPHNCEIAWVRCRRRRLRTPAYQVQIAIFGGLRIRITFDRLFGQRSPRPPGVVHEY